MIYKVVDENGEVLCEGVKTLEEVRQAIITAFLYDATDDDTIMALETATPEKLLKDANLTLLKE